MSKLKGEGIKALVAVLIVLLVIFFLFFYAIKAVANMKPRYNENLRYETKEVNLWKIK